MVCSDRLKSSYDTCGTPPCLVGIGLADNVVDCLVHWRESVWAGPGWTLSGRLRTTVDGVGVLVRDLNAELLHTEW